MTTFDALVRLQNFYLDYVNNYLTVDKFAEDNFLNLHEATHLINAGKVAHETVVELLK